MKPILVFNNLPEQDLVLIAQKLAPLLRPGDFIGLSGQLGAGKSVLARALIRTAMGDENLDVPSPTFTLVHPYSPPPPFPEIIHIDLFRVEAENELAELGFDDNAHAAFLVEWPERLGPAFPEDGLVIKIEAGEKKAVRTLSFLGNQKWDARLKKKFN